MHPDGYADDELDAHGRQLRDALQAAIAEMQETAEVRKIPLEMEKVKAAGLRLTRYVKTGPDDDDSELDEGSSLIVTCVIKAGPF